MRRIKQAIKTLTPIQVRMVLIIYAIRGETSASELADKFKTLVENNSGAA